MASSIEKVESDLVRGAAPTAVLQLLSRRPMYGYEIVGMLRDESAGALALGQSTLYPLLYNLESKGFISSDERASDAGRTRRYYSITTAGRKALKSQREQWQALSSALGRLGIISPLPNPGRS
jgi:PadR family transcriptional regulator PadR